MIEFFDLRLKHAPSLHFNRDHLFSAKFNINDLSALLLISDENECCRINQKNRGSHFL